MPMHMLMYTPAHTYCPLPTHKHTNTRKHARMYTQYKEGSTLVHQTWTLMQCMYIQWLHTPVVSHMNAHGHHQYSINNNCIQESWVYKWWITVHITHTHTYVRTYVHTWTHNAQLDNCSHTSTTTTSITTATRESGVQVVNTCTALYLGTPSQVPHVHTCLNCKMVLVSIIYQTSR